MSWFEIDKDGLRQLQGAREKWRLVNELVQNAFDEEITYCDINVKHRDGEAVITVTDDSPEGFRYLKDAYTLFGYTYKRKDPTKRGRFNIGEKQIISICRSAKVRTTKGTVIFHPDGTRTQNYNKRETGTEVSLRIPMKEKELGKVIEELQQVLPPKNIAYKVNGSAVAYKEPFITTEAVLLTEIFDDANKIMKRTERKTKVNIYEKKDEEQAMIYEMGIPIECLDDKYSVDVQQKIPLTLDRTNILPSYLRRLRAVVLNATYQHLTEQEPSAEWVREATRDTAITKEALVTVADKRWGEQRCYADMNNPQSIEEALARGYTLVRPSDVDTIERKVFKETGALLKSSEIFKTQIVEGKTVPPDRWTEEQKRVVKYAKMIAKETLGIKLEVQLIEANCSLAADYGNGVLRLNISRLPDAWWRKGISEEVTNLLIHEIGHYRGLHHLSEEYHRTITEIGAKLTMLALNSPDKFK